MYAAETAHGKITVTLVKAKEVQIAPFDDMTDLQTRGQVRSIIKVKSVAENNTHI